MVDEPKSWELSPGDPRNKHAMMVEIADLDARLERVTAERDRANARAKAAEAREAELREEVEEAWREISKCVEIGGAEVSSTRSVPLWEAIEVMRLHLRRALTGEKGGT